MAKRQHSGFVAALAAVLLLAACATAPRARDAAAPRTSAQTAALLSRAKEALDSNHLAEAIRSYVQVLAIAESAQGGAASSDGAKAQDELSRIAAGLSLEPGPEWFDEKGNQVSGDTRSLAKGRGIMPTVYLFANLGTGKTPVADAPIRFEFKSNSGQGLPLVTTDAYGKANTTITAVLEPAAPVVLRAMPTFSAGGRTFAFSSVFRDFSWTPKAPAARLAVLESGGAEGSPAKTIDTLAKALTPLGLDCLPFDSALSEELFLKAQSGEAAAMAQLGIKASPTLSAYLILVSIRAGQASQMELNGQKYNIFYSDASVSFRILRSDGSLIHAISLPQIKGQGRSAELARAEAVASARQTLAETITKNLEEIRAKLD